MDYRPLNTPSKDAAYGYNNCSQINVPLYPPSFVN